MQSEEETERVREEEREKISSIYFPNTLNIQGRAGLNTWASSTELILVHPWVQQGLSH